MNVDQLPLWLVLASLALNGRFLHRLLVKLDRLYDCVAGTTEKPGLLARITAVEEHLGIVNEHGAPEWPDAERRRGERRKREARG